MADPHEEPPPPSENKNILPDVVHSQQIPAVGAAVADQADVSHIDTGQRRSESEAIEVENISETESISEHILSKLDYSVTESENASQTHESHGPLRVESADAEQEKLSRHSSLNIPYTHSPLTDNVSAREPSKQSTSLPLDLNAVSDILLLSEDSQVPLPLSSDRSKDYKKASDKTPPSNGSESIESPRSDEYQDSLNEEASTQSNASGGEEVDDGTEKSNASAMSKSSSGSEEIIKLDIRGSGVPKFPLQTAKIIFGPPPEGSTIIGGNIDQIPAFPNLLSPFLVGAGDSMKVQEFFDETDFRNPSPSRSPDLTHSREVTPECAGNVSPNKSLSSDKIEQDMLVEEVTVGYDTREHVDKVEDCSIPTQPKSMVPEDVASFSTFTTEYKTICEEYQIKLVHLENAITDRDHLIEELTNSLQRSVAERDDLRTENVHLTSEVHNLQHIVAEQSQSDHDTVKGQISDFMKYEAMLKDDSTKFYSAIMSGGSSARSSNGEKDMDREEITINYSRSDLKSSSSDDFQTSFEAKIGAIISKFDEFIEENLRNKLRESIIQVLCDEIGKMRLESDTEIKELEMQVQQDKQAFNVEVRKLRDLLSSVKAGSADIDALREELSLKHEKEMETLRTYFEKKCSDMERSYSEEVWRGRCVSPPSSPEPEGLEGVEAGAGDGRRRTRSAELPYEGVYEVESFRRHESQLSALRAAHAHVVEQLEEQITHLKAQIQSSETPEGNVSVYQQDIDLELEKKEKDAVIEKRLEEVRQEVVHQLQEQIQVLLSDPDAELSSWPLELVALRDRIYGEKIDKELSSLREEVPGGEADKWRQRRNHSFDSNRRLEEVTKERDSLKLVAASLQRAVSQLVAYCACAEDELNRTVLAQLLPHDTTSDADSRSSTPNLSLDLNSSAVSRSSRHVHFAPDLHSILNDVTAEGLIGYLQEQRDLSADIKKELEFSLKRLRHEAHELLDLSAKLAAKEKPTAKMLESPQVKITEIGPELDPKRSCDDCEMYKKNMEDSMCESLHRERLLRAELDAAASKINALLAQGDDQDLVAEGYGIGQSPIHPRPRARRIGGCGGAVSLDGGGSPRDADVLKERDDLLLQLEAANRQLRSTRQFVEEQAAEREAERDEFARRLSELRDENSRLTTRLQSNARILSEVEQLESQTREMNQLITELETKKAAKDEELKSTQEKIDLLRDIIANLEGQLEQKTTHEAEILKQLQEMKDTIEERDSKMRTLLGELEELKSERVDDSNALCVKCGLEEDKYAELLDRVKEQATHLEAFIHRRARRVTAAHEVCSAPCSEPSEDVSIRDQRPELTSPSTTPSPRGERLAELAGVWDRLDGLARAEDAALKRVQDLEMQRNQLKDVAQEVRAERDVLQARMSEQALRISSLSARLQQHRNDAEALAHQAHSQLSVQLHDTMAEVQRLKEELESKDKQMTRIKQALDERDKQEERQHGLYGNSCTPQDKVIILERELSATHTRVAALEAAVRAAHDARDDIQRELVERTRELAEREDQMQELLALKLDDENQKEDRSDVQIEGKASARTLSDIVSISEFDEQDHQMRKAELKGHNLNLTGAPFETSHRTLNKTLPPELQKPNMSSLNIDYGDHFDTENFSPRADSLPGYLTSTQNKDATRAYKRNVNETMVFGTNDKFGDSVKHSTAQNIPDNCSMYPNRDVDESKEVTVEPKKINFSLEATQDNKTQDEEFTSLRELGITLDIRQENFPDILTQLKYEIKKSRGELEDCKSELKNAEEQLCEFPALKEEVEELKALLENTMATMDNDKKFYENQLDNFTSNKKLLEQRLTELSQEVTDKTKDLHLLKEDILRRENMILELAKEKRNLTNKMTELEVKMDELQSRNNALEKYEVESRQLKDKVNEIDKLQQLFTEKNQQIDSLNQHLDRFDDMQRNLNVKTEELESLKEAFEEKSNELFQMQDVVEALNKDLAKTNEENLQMNAENSELKQKLSKLEKEQENASLKLQNSESEVERVNSLNNELTAKIDELKLLADKLKDRETEVEILSEDINSYHEEIASLKDQLKMVSRSPSPRNKEEKKQHRPGEDKKQLAKIRKQISLLQHELDFNKKELNDKAFELAKAKLDITEMTNTIGQQSNQLVEKETSNAELVQHQQELQDDLRRLSEEKQKLVEQLEAVGDRIREEGRIEELQNKLRERTRRCDALEEEVRDLKEVVSRLRSSSPAPNLSPRRSPTLELESAVRAQLDYSHELDEDIMEQILSGSDEHEEIPRLALNTSKSSSSIHSSSSERLNRLRVENDKLTLQLNNLELRLKDKDALIAELNRIRDKLTSEAGSASARLAAEREHSQRLQLLLHTHHHTAETLQNQDTNMITILKKRLESSMAAEAELQQREALLRRQLEDLARAGDQKMGQELGSTASLKSTLALLQSQLSAEKARRTEEAAEAARREARAERDVQRGREDNNRLLAELAKIKGLKHDIGVELVRAKELLSVQADTIRELQAARQHQPAEPARADDTQLAIRYLHGRCARLESCRKALVWQKRYLQRVAAGYESIGRALKARAPPESKGNRFRVVSVLIVSVVRMSFLVRRRAGARRAAHVLTPTAGTTATPGSQYKAPGRPLPLARRLLPADCSMNELARQSPYNSPRDPFILSTPRGEVASAYLNKLELVSRCLNQAMDTRDAP